MLFRNCCRCFSLAFYLQLGFWIGPDAAQASVSLIHRWGLASIPDSLAPFFPVGITGVLSHPIFWCAGDWAPSAIGILQLQSQTSQHFSVLPSYQLVNIQKQNASFLHYFQCIFLSFKNFYKIYSTRDLDRESEVWLYGHCVFEMQKNIKEVVFLKMLTCFKNIFNLFCTF